MKLACRQHFYKYMRCLKCLQSTLWHVFPSLVSYRSQAIKEQIEVQQLKRERRIVFERVVHQLGCSEINSTKQYLNLPTTAFLLGLQAIQHTPVWVYVYFKFMLPGWNAKETIRIIYYPQKFAGWSTHIIAGTVCKGVLWGIKKGNASC